MHGAGTRKRVTSGTRKDPRQSGIDQGLKNIKTGRYVRNLELWPELAAKLLAETREGKAEGATFDAEIGLLRHCLGELVAKVGTADLTGLQVIREQVEAIVKATAAKSRAEQGVKVDFVGAVQPMLREIGSLVREGVTRYVTDDAQRHALEAFLDAGFARAFSRVAPAAVSSELDGD